MMRGFTLLEMLIAIAIIGVIGSAVSTAIGGMANKTRGLEKRTLANWIASNHLTRMRMLQRREAQSLAEGTEQTRLVFADRQWEVETKIKTTEHPWIRRIEVSVFEATDEEGRQGPMANCPVFWVSIDGLNNATVLRAQSGALRFSKGFYPHGNSCGPLYFCRCGHGQRATVGSNVRCVSGAG